VQNAQPCYFFDERLEHHIVGFPITLFPVWEGLLPERTITFGLMRLHQSLQMDTILKKLWTLN